MPLETTTDLGIRLEDLWDAERCAWHVDFDGGAGTELPWIVVLEWTQEHGNDHHADWVTFTWLFYGTTAEEALSDAVVWCEGLVPFRRCDACDGVGEYGPADRRVTCEECNGSGLAEVADAA